ncbi:hypothetical protein LQZ19_18730 [Treponema primitia]|uniref:hypothetical protein n=1 Tax=Treponema primitia TaxID=88058 RepID=UPI00397ECABF
MAKVIGNPGITFPSEQEITEKGAKENLHNLKQKVQELRESFHNDKIFLPLAQNPPSLDKVVEK